MPTSTYPPVADEFDGFVMTFEAAQGRDGDCDLADFLPAADHPLFDSVLRELVRLDLEYSRLRGRPRAQESYRAAFPRLFSDRAALREVAFEEYRLRLQAGESVTAAEYTQRYGVDTSDWPGPEQGSPNAGSRTEFDSTPPTLRRPVADGSGNLEEAALDYAAFRLGPEADDPAAIDSWCESVPSGRAFAELFRDVHQSDPEAACRLAQASTAMPEVGTNFLEFHLAEELGRGTFGRVYLARQAGLGDRPVALKVSADLSGETHALSQLQHTHIVPVYSVHRSGPFQAVCMPYFGSTTLGHVLKEIQGHETMPQSGTDLVSTLRARAGEGDPPSRRQDARETAKAVQTVTSGDDARFTVSTGPKSGPSAVVTELRQMSYVQAVLWVAGRLADALQHAHERGIVHRDLKPANILLTDQGPMLLDFNLAHDTKQRGASFAFLGGTLPYMAPEHLKAFQGGTQPVDARSDLYSLGVVLYEMLTGHPPFPVHRGPLQDVLAAMLDDRKGPPPSVRKYNRAVPPSIESLVQHLLHPEPALRYQSARELQEDLQRHGEHRALRYAAEPSVRERVRKWAYRNRHVLLGSAAAAVIGVLATITTIQQRERPRLLAMSQYKQFMNLYEERNTPLRLRQLDFPEKVASASNDANAALGLYEVLEDPFWQRSTVVLALPAQEQKWLRNQVAYLLLLLNQSVLERAGRQSQGVSTPDLQRALVRSERALACYDDGEGYRSAHRQRAELLKRLGRGAEAEAETAVSMQTPVRSTDDHYLTACEDINDGHFADALVHLNESVHLSPKNAGAWFDKGRCHDQLEQSADAETAFTSCIALRPTYPGAYYNRGLARVKQKRYADAITDFDEAIRLDPKDPNAHRQRALAYQNLGKYSEALADFDQARDLGSTPVEILFRKARVHELAADRSAADREREHGLKLSPINEEDWIARGLARVRTDPKGALEDFDNAIGANKRSVAGRQNKANVLSEQLGKTDEAIATLSQLLDLYPDFLFARAGRGVLLARQGKRAEALQDAEACLKRSPSPFITYQVAGIYALTSKQVPDDANVAIRLLALALRRDCGLDYIATDSDLEPLRNNARFQRLVESAKALRVD